MELARVAARQARAAAAAGRGGGLRGGAALDPSPWKADRGATVREGGDRWEGPPFEPLIDFLTLASA